MKKLGIVAIIIGIILAAMAVLGFISLIQSGVSGAEFSEAVEYANAWGMTDSMTSNNRLSLLIVQYRILLLILGLSLIITGIILIRKNRIVSGHSATIGSHRREQVGRISSIGAEVTNRIRSSASKLGARHNRIDGEEWEEVPEEDIWEEDNPDDEQFDPNHCCICGNSLDAGYAVLLRTQNGEEARIDESCYRMIDVMAKSDNKYEIRRAIAAAKSYLGSADIDVRKKLKGYINSAEDFLNEKQ